MCTTPSCSNDINEQYFIPIPHQQKKKAKGEIDSFPNNVIPY